MLLELYINVSKSMFYIDWCLMASSVFLGWLKVECKKAEGSWRHLSKGERLRGLMTSD
jgi:hypothetical protein